MNNKNDGLDERIYLSLLYDFYGPLLKAKQREMFEMHIIEDYGYSEIAEELDISRQAVHEAVNKAKKQLAEYEDKLHLVRRFDREYGLVNDLYDELKNNNFYNNRRIKDIMKQMEDIV